MRALAVLTALTLVGAPPAWAAHTRDDPEAYELLSRVREAMQHAHTGEAVHLVWSDKGNRASLATVRSGDGEVTVQDREGWTLHLADEGGGLVDHVRGWHIPFPRLRPLTSPDPIAALRAKYRASAGPHRSVAGARCRTVELHRRADDQLRERLCIAEDTGLVLRREAFATDGTKTRLSTYLTLEEAPLRADPRAARTATSLAPVPLTQHNQEVAPLSTAELDALREAGWVVPESLPGGYEPLGGFSVEVEDASPLHLVYRDGLYTVSVFQQTGQLDPDNLPPGAEPAGDLGGYAFEWPEAMPQRLVWESGGITYTVVGDAPREELRAIVRALPAPDEPDTAADGPAERLRRGLGRLWAWVSGGARG